MIKVEDLKSIINSPHEEVVVDADGNEVFRGDHFKTTFKFTDYKDFVVTNIDSLLPDEDNNPGLSITIQQIPTRKASPKTKHKK